MSDASPRLANGILPRQAIEGLIASGVIEAVAPIEPAQIQPASLDLRLGGVATRVRASFLPGAGRTVAERLERLALHEFPLEQGAVLETGCVYIVPLLERVTLRDGLAASANPKSSTGRLDVFTRVIADGVAAFDTVPEGYAGPLYAEISPRTFPVLVRTGSRLSQIRFRKGHAVVDDPALQRLHDEVRLVDTPQPGIQAGLALSVDLSTTRAGGVVGYRGRRHTGLIDIDRVDGYVVEEFWDPVRAMADGTLVLDPNEFYILASKEAVQVPPGYAAEMVPIDPLVGEFRVHYAGFFDPGFGWSGAGGAGSRAVLEVRSREVPFILEHGQVIGRLVYERLTQEPSQLYGTGMGSNYQAQGLKLSKHFRAVGA